MVGAAPLVFFLAEALFGGSDNKLAVKPNNLSIIGDKEGNKETKEDGPRDRMKKIE